MPVRESDSHEVIAQRLEDGWKKIEETRNEIVREQYTNHWMKLLRQYEQRYDAAKEAQYRG